MSFKSCRFSLAGTNFYQLQYFRGKWRNPAKLFWGIVDGVRLQSPTDSPVARPLTQINDRTEYKTFPTNYETTGVDAAAELDRVFIYFKGQDFIKMNENQHVNMF